MFVHNGGNRPEPKTTHMLHPIHQVAAPGAKSTVSDCNWLLILHRVLLQTWLARSWYCFFSSGFSAYHHSPRILLTDRLSWFGYRWWTSARWRLLKIMNAFIGRRTWSRKPSFAYIQHIPDLRLVNHERQHITQNSVQTSSGADQRRRPQREQKLALAVSTRDVPMRHNNWPINYRPITN